MLKGAAPPEDETLKSRKRGRRTASRYLKALGLQTHICVARAPTRTVEIQLNPRRTHCERKRIASGDVWGRSGCCRGSLYFARSAASG